MSKQEIPARHADANKQAILQRAIRKAVSNGYDTGAPDKEALASVIVYYTTDHHWYEMIYDHEFAKALWHKDGKAEMYYPYPIYWGLFKDRELDTTTALLAEWQYHLQQMVIADDPIKYLGEHI